jgi:hypothetical protein
VLAAPRWYALSTLSDKKQIVSDDFSKKTIAAAGTGAESLLLPELAFVVQFRTETELEQGHWVGRVEHVVSGHAARFHSLDELRAFLARVLATVRAQSTEEP